MNTFVRTTSRPLPVSLALVVGIAILGVAWPAFSAKKVDAGYAYAKTSVVTNADTR